MFDEDTRPIQGEEWFVTAVVWVQPGAHEGALRLPIQEQIGLILEEPKTTQLMSLLCPSRGL